MRALLDWLLKPARPNRPAPPRRSDAPLECVTCGRRKPRGGAWTPARSPLDTQPIYTVCADCATKRGPA